MLQCIVDVQDLNKTGMRSLILGILLNKESLDSNGNQHHTLFVPFPSRLTP